MYTKVALPENLKYVVENFTSAFEGWEYKGAIRYVKFFAFFSGSFFLLTVASLFGYFMEDGEPLIVLVLFLGAMWLGFTIGGVLEYWTNVRKRVLVAEGKVIRTASEYQTITDPRCLAIAIAGLDVEIHNLILEAQSRHFARVYRGEDEVSSSLDEIVAMTKQYGLEVAFEIFYLSEMWEGRKPTWSVDHVEVFGISRDRADQILYQQKMMGTYRQLLKCRELLTGSEHVSMLFTRIVMTKRGVIMSGVDQALDQEGIEILERLEREVSESGV